MRAAASESNPANPIAGSWLAVFGSLRGSAGGAAGEAVAAGAGAGVGRAAGAAGSGAGEAAAAALGTTTGTIFAVSTSSSRRLSGFLSVSLSSLPLICIQWPTIASVILAFSGLSSVRASAPGSTVHVASGTLATGPFFGRANTYLSFFPPRTASPLNQTSHRGNLPALVLRQQAPIPSLRVCGFDHHHTERDDNDRCTIDRVKSHP